MFECYLLVGITNDGSAPIYSDDYFKGHNRKFSIQVRPTEHQLSTSPKLHTHSISY